LKTHQEKKFELKKRGFNLFFEDPKFQTIVKKLKPIGNFWYTYYTDNYNYYNNEKLVI
jgi:hypothetical protein